MNKKDTETLLRAAGADLGTPLEDHHITRLTSYLTLLAKWNTRINLTATRSEHELVTQHLADALALLPHLPADATRAIDVGSGGGFPSVVVAIMRPTLQMTALEPVHKKHAFLATVRRELDLPNFQPLPQRLDAHAQAQTFHPYDVALSRATFPLPTWLTQGAKLIRPGGLVLGMEGATQHPLPEGARRHPYNLPNTAGPKSERTRAVIVHIPHPTH